MNVLAPLLNTPVPDRLTVEVTTRFQIPSLIITGLPSQEIMEARERIRSAIENSGFEFPSRKILINLSPARVPKEGTGLDLPMALAILVHQGEKFHTSIDTRTPLMAWGELGLGGNLISAGQPLRTLYAAMKAGVTSLILPEKAHDELIASIRSHASSLGQSRTLPRLVFIRRLKDLKSGLFHCCDRSRCLTRNRKPPLSGVISETTGLLPLSASNEWFLTIAMGGPHHLLLVGPRGAGKSHLLRWLEALHQILCRSGSQPVDVQQVLTHEMSSGEKGQTFRWISTQIRPAALLGRWERSGLKPGEYSLAHGGWLAADEIPEWHRDSRESLREPLQNSEVILQRRSHIARFPARFHLAATANPCPCGLHPRNRPDSGSLLETCQCTESQIRKYRQRISGPLLDRIDLIHWTRPFPLSVKTPAPAVKDRIRPVLARILKAWRLSKKAHGCRPGHFSPVMTEELIRQARLESGLNDSDSLRARHKLFQVACTIALLKGRALPVKTDLLFARQFKKGWNL